MDNLQKFVERFLELLSDRDMKPGRLAAELNVRRKVISRYANGERLPDLQMALRLSEYFHCSIDFLLGRTDEGSQFEPLPAPPFYKHFIDVLNFCQKSIYRVAKDTAISEATLFNWKMNRTSPTLENLVRLSDYLDCSIEFILGREN